MRHHARFYLSILVGALVFPFADALPFSAEASSLSMHLIVAGDTFFAVYLVSSALLCLDSTPDELRRRASYEDEGVMVIFILTLSAVSLCMAALFALLDAPGPPDPFPLLLAVLSVLLGWLTLHTVLAFRYAHLYYTRVPVSGESRDAGGLQFPGDQEPGPWDFLYYSFVIGMTAQVSDVPVSDASMRRTTLAHGVASFFFNTVILALAVNIAAGYSH